MTSSIYALVAIGTDWDYADWFKETRRIYLRQKLSQVKAKRSVIGRNSNIKPLFTRRFVFYGLCKEDVRTKESHTIMFS